MNNWLPWLLEYFATFFEGALIVRFVYNYCGYKYNKNSKNIVLFVCQLLFSSLIILFNKITIFESIGVIIYAIALFIMALAFLDGDIIQKAFVSVFPILCNVIIAGFTMPTVAALFHISLSEIYTVGNLHRIIGVVITKIALYLILRAVASPNKRKEDIVLTNSEWVQVILVSTFSIFMIAVSINLQLEYVENIVDKGIVFLIAGITLLDIYFLYVVLKINRYNRIKQENELLRQQQHFYAKYAENIQQQYEEIKSLRHDLKHSLSVIGVLVGEGKLDEAKNFIERHNIMSKTQKVFIDTKNDFLDAIINSKLSLAHQYNIKTICSVSSSCEKIDGIDLCNLLGNLLDNAIEACVKKENKEPEMLLKIWNSPGKIMILVKNSIPYSVLSGNHSLNSDKKDKENHGLGIKTIKSIVEKYGGLLDIYEEHKSFCVLVTLFIY